MVNYVTDAIIKMAPTEPFTYKPGTARDRGLRHEYEYDSDYNSEDYVGSILDLTCAQCGDHITRDRFLHKHKLCGDCGLSSSEDCEEGDTSDGYVPPYNEFHYNYDAEQFVKPWEVFDD